MLRRHYSLISVLVMICFVFSPLNGYSLPEGENIASGNGSASFTRPDAVTFNVDQSTERVIIDYTGFDINAGETANFYQPGTSAIAVNRVASGNPSDILGNLNANGRIFILNPDGVIFGAGSQVDTAGLLASTLNMNTSDTDFMSGADSIDFQSFADPYPGAVVNYGQLNSPGGFVALLGPRVENRGSIAVNAGRVTLAAGEAMTVPLDAANLISVAVTTPTDITAGSTEAGIITSGTIEANGGKVLLDSKVINTVFDNAINTSGIIRGKEIVIKGNGNINIVNTNIFASAPSDDVKVHILASPADDLWDPCITIEDSEIEASVDNDGDAEVKIAAGKYEYKNGVDEYVDIFGETYNELEQIKGSGKIIVKTAQGVEDEGTDIEASVGGQGSAKVRLLAKDIEISDSFLNSVVEDKGEALIDIFAGDFDYYHKYWDHKNTFFTGGELEITDSGILANVLNGDPEDEWFTRAHVRLEGYYIDFERSAVIAQQTNNGSAFVDIVAGNYTDKQLTDQYSLYGGELNIADPVSFIDDGEILVIDFIPSVGALVGGSGNAEISLESGAEEIASTIYLTDCSILSQVEGKGSASVEAHSGNYMENKTQTSAQGTYTETEQRSFGGGEFYISDSTVTARVKGLEENEPCGQEESSAEIFMTGSDLWIDNSDLLAEVLGTGDTLIELTAADVFTQYQKHQLSELEGSDWNFRHDFEENESSEGGFIEISETSTVSAITDGSLDHENARVEISAGDIEINSSDIMAEMTGYGNATVKISAGDFEYDYTSEEYLNNPEAARDDEYEAEGSYTKTEDFYGGSLDILADSSVTATVLRPEPEGDIFTEALVDLYAENILVDNSDVSALFTGKGEAEVYAYATGISHSYSNVAYDFYFDNDDHYQDYESIHDFLANTPGTIDIVNSSNLSADAAEDEAEIYLEIGSDQMIANVVMDVRNGIDPGYVNIEDSTVTAEVKGEGRAGIYIYDEYGTIRPLEDLADFLDLDLEDMIDDLGGPIEGPITVSNSTVSASTGINFEEGDPTAVYMITDHDLEITDSNISAQGTKGLTGIALLSDDMLISNSNVYEHTSDLGTGAVILAAFEDLDVLGGSVRATSDNFRALMLALAGEDLNAEGLVSAEGGSGMGILALLALEDLYAGNVLASGNLDGFDYLKNYILFQTFGKTEVNIDSQYTYGSLAFISSLMGDVYLGNVSGDAVIASALGTNFDELSYLFNLISGNTQKAQSENGDPGTGSIFDIPGNVSGHYLGMLARNDIGTSEKAEMEYAGPITTDVDIVSAYSYDTGSIYLKEANDIELGLVLPISIVYDYGDSGTDFTAGTALAANNGVISVISNGDMLVNSVISPRAGIFLQSETGSIYAGKALPPVVYQEGLAGMGTSVSSFLNDLLGLRIDPYLISEFAAEIFMDLEGTSWGFLDYFTPITVSCDNEYVYNPNIIAGGYSYISTPQGTIGAGTPDDKDPAISSEIFGEVWPAVEAVTGLFPAPGIDLSRYTPPGLVYFCSEGETARAIPVDNGDYYCGSQIWPETIADPEISSENPLFVVARINELSEPDYRALPEWFLESLQGTEDQVAALTLEIGSPVLPPAPEEDGAIYNTAVRDFRAYYELLDNYRVVFADPAQPTEYYAYHPLTPTDTAAFDDIALDTGAYDFIADRINYRRPLAPYFGEEEEEERRRR